MDRDVSIEFIEFGNNLDAALRLKMLDEDLKNDGIPDLADVEHCTGDVNKMLLGSIVPINDELYGLDDSS